jgi:hypothetical protein
MTNPITIEVDVAGDCPVQIALTTISDFDGDLLNFIACGPGGGNPCLTIRFPTVDLARAYLNECGSNPDQLDMYVVD